MSMAQEIDYSTLKWVKDEIDESLKQTRQALESYVENPDDKTQIRFCATYLHQIYGTLQMVEIYGAYPFRYFLLAEVPFPEGGREAEPKKPLR